MPRSHGGSGCVSWERRTKSGRRSGSSSHHPKVSAAELEQCFQQVWRELPVPVFWLLGMASQGLTASATSPVHLVLIRNEHGPLLRVVVDAADPKDVRVKAVSFKLDGTDDLGDLDSLTLFSTRDKEEFASTARFGEPVKPASTVTIRGERALRAGKNVFWLSCLLKETANLSHRVAGACTAIETTGGKLTPSDGSPGVRHRIGVALRKHQDDGVHTYRIPALAATTKGTLVCVYDMRRRESAHDNGARQGQTKIDRDASLDQCPRGGHRMLYSHGRARSAGNPGGPECRHRVLAIR